MNPFKVGKEYSKEHFIDRKEELKYIKDVLESGNNLVLMAPRRFGKTWLLKKLAESAPFEILYVDLLGIFSLKGFTTQLIKQAFNILKNKEPAFFISQYFKNLGRYITFSIEFQSVSFNFSPEIDDEILINESYSILSALSSASRKRVVVIIDEFQEYERVCKNLPESLKSFSQSEKNVSFVFSGSRRHLLEKLFFHSTGILFHSALRAEIQARLPKNDCINYAQKKFKDTYKALPEESGKLIYELSQGHPYFFQLLCFETWNNSEGIATEDIVQKSFEAILERESYAYDTLIDSLEYKYAKNLLALLSREGDHIFSKEALKKYEIPNTPTTDKTLKALLECGIIEKLGRGKYIITDPLFEKYIQKRLQN